MGRVFALLLALVLVDALGCRFNARGLSSQGDAGSDLVSVLDMRFEAISSPDTSQGDAAGDLPPPLDLLADTPTSCATILDPDTLMLLRFQKVNGSTFNDAAGAHDGTVTPKPTLVPGPPGCGQALAIPAAGGTLVEVPDHAAFQLSKGSVDFWVRFNAAASTTTFNGIISRDASNAAKPGHLTIFRSCGGSIVVRLQNNKQDYYQCSTATAPVGAWFHVGVNFGAATGLQLFVNGKQQSATKTIKFGASNPCSLAGACGSSTTSGISGNENPWIIGASAMSTAEGSGSPAAYPLAGAIDEVRISRIPRTF